MTEKTTASKFILEVTDDVVRRPPPREWDSPEEYTVRVYFVAARMVDSSRFWYDYTHYATFDCPVRAERLLERINRAWANAEDCTISEECFTTSSYWEKNTDVDPLQELAPFGIEWQRERQEARDAG